MEDPRFATATYDNTPLFSLMGLKTWGRLVDAYDGDTLKVILPLGEKLYRFNVRLYGIDTCEMKSKNPLAKQKAIQARDRILELATNSKQIPSFSSKKDLQQWLGQNLTMVYVDCLEMDKYGRALCKVYQSPGSTKSFSDILVEEKLAYPYFGETKLTEEQQLQYLGVYA